MAQHKPWVNAGLAVCLITIIAGPYYTEPGYSVVAHSVSELAGQHTDNAWIMRFGLVALGASAILGYVQRRNHLNVCFLIFGMCMLLTAAFPHKPFIDGRDYSARLDTLHSAFASLGGLASVMGFILLGINERWLKKKMLYFAIAGAYTLLPMIMFAWPGTQGIFQRLIFASYILWAWLEYPKALPVDQSA